MKWKSLLCFIVVSVVLSGFVLAESVEKRVVFAGAGRVDVDLKFSTNGFFLSDNYFNVLKPDSYVCNMNDFLSNLAGESVVSNTSGEWYLNGGSVGSPKITFNEELFDSIYSLLKCENLEFECSNYTLHFNGSVENHTHCRAYAFQQYFNIGGRSVKCTVDCSVRDGSPERSVLFCFPPNYLEVSNQEVQENSLYEYWRNLFGDVDFSEVTLRNGAGDEYTALVGVLCKSSTLGIKCISLATSPFNGLAVSPPLDDLNDFVVVKKEDLLADDFTLGFNIDDELNDFVESYSLNDATLLNASLRVKSFNYQVLLNSVVIDVVLENDGELPLRISSVKLQAGDSEFPLEDLFSTLKSEIEVNQSVNAVFVLDGSVCDVVNKNLRLIINYEAHNFFCNYSINKSIVSSFRVPSNLELDVEKKVVYPDTDFFVNSKLPRTNFDSRIDLHVGNYNNGIMRSFMYYDFSQIDKDELVSAFLVLKVFENSSTGNVELYDLTFDWNPDIVSWLLQPKAGVLLDSNVVIPNSEVRFDITQSVKNRSYGFMIKAQDESPGNDVVFYALESKYKPRIELYYRSEGSTVADACK